MIQLFSSSADVFSVKLATKEEVLDRSQDTGDVNIIWVFTFNSNQDFCLFEFILITFLLLFSMLVASIGVFCILSSNNPHRNNRLIVLSGILCWFELVISRMLVFAFQFSKSPTQTSSKLLFWAALFRYHYMFFGVHTLLCVTGERAMATAMLKDYENKPRVWIAVFLITGNFLVSATYAFLAVSQFIMMKFVFTVCLVVTISSMVILETIYFMNRKRLAAIIRHDSTMVLYTLSTKYQLQENVQSCKLIRPAVITVGGFIILVILTECLPILLDFNDRLQAWCNLVFDTMVHINALVVVPTVILLMEGFRKVFLQQYRKIIQSIRPKLPARKKSIFVFSKRTENEGDVYFEMFNKSVSPITSRDKK